MSPFFLRARGVIATALLAALLILPAAGLQAIERRKPQFSSDPGYLFFPIPYSMPGIGDGFFFTALAMNVFETNADAVAILVTGDAAGRVAGVLDMHLWPETLILDVFDQDISKALVNIYEKRGMDTNKDDFVMAELDKVTSRSVSLTLSLFDRRLEVAGGMETFAIRITRFRDNEANIIPEWELAEPITQESKSQWLSLHIDYTDDRQDPRKGVQLGVRRNRSPPDNSDSPDYYRWDYTTSFYLPVGNQSTWMLHYFQSDAQMLRVGQTNLDVLAQPQGCATYDECTAAQKSVVDDNYAGNKYGNAASLGGDSRLRAYPMGRFQGAHTIFYGSEFRWNMTEESTPFDYFIWKDVRTAMQVAFFYEIGSVADLKSEVGDTFRTAYGTGFRLVSASGIVYRADLAFGSEGAETVVFFFYPY